MTTAMFVYTLTQIVMATLCAAFAAKCYRRSQAAEASAAFLRRENDLLHRELERSNVAYKHAYDRPNGHHINLDESEHH